MSNAATVASTEMRQKTPEVLLVQGVQGYSLIPTCGLGACNTGKDMKVPGILGFPATLDGTRVSKL